MDLRRFLANDNGTLWADRPGPQRLCGQGLDLVVRLSLEWGVERSEPSPQVWDRILAQVSRSPAHLRRLM